MSLEPDPNRTWFQETVLKVNSWFIDSRIPIIMGTAAFVLFVGLGLAIIIFTTPDPPPPSSVNPTSIPTPTPAVSVPASSTPAPTRTAKPDDSVTAEELGFRIIGLPEDRQIVEMPLVLEAAFETPSRIDSVAMYYRTPDNQTWQLVNILFERPYVFRWNWGEAIGPSPFEISFDITLDDRSVLLEQGLTEFPLQRISATSPPAPSGTEEPIESTEPITSEEPAIEPEPTQADNQ